MSDQTWTKFFEHRTRPLHERFPGQYRAIVVETNDPLNSNRIRIKCPEMHDNDLKPEDCPWAVPSNDLGGYRSGRFSHPCIGDWVFVVFEKQHPYSIIWTGFANLTRRKSYTYEQVSQITPLALNKDGKPSGRPKDYSTEYLPKDGRPMAHGWKDRYGNIEIHSSVGFYPNEHSTAPPTPDYDPISKNDFEQARRKPLVNNPDKKYIAKMTKYGHMLILGDQGYYWKKDGELGEFEGKFEEDEKFETKRFLYNQRLLNENKARSDSKFGDQRRMGMLTRYGHRIECRDVGWAQEGPIPSKSRQGEYGDPRILSKEKENDFRWIKIRTKGGMLFQAYDKGFHPNDDRFVKRKLIEEQAHQSEREHVYWANKDARWIRIVTRNGMKLVLDDRGTDNILSHNREIPRPNGILIKGRRTPAAKARPARGNPRGYYWEFNENDQANHTTWGTPLGQAIEMNDRYQYMMLAATLGKGFSSKWRGLKENEFLRKPTMMRDPEKNSYHLKLDQDNEYLRLKTRAGKGSKAERPANPSGVGGNEIHQGIEARDGIRGDGPWVELVDCQHRGFWFSKRYQVSIWRSKEKKQMYMWMDERKNEIVIYNKDGKTIIYSENDIEFISGKNIKMQAAGSISMKAGATIPMQAGGTRLTVTNSAVLASSVVNGVKFNESPGGQVVQQFPVPVIPERIEPLDRAKTYNEPFEECPQEEVEHPIQ